MVMLPTFDVDPTVAQRIQAAYANYGPGTAQENYRAWLRQQIKLFVLTQEIQAVQVKHATARDAETAAVTADLNTVLSVL